jgi:hypothetical protein
MDQTISWAATAATIIAATMTASNLGARITGYGFAVFTLGSLCWLATGLLTGQPALVWTNVVLTGLNLFGIWRWLGRQTSIESGANAAASASAQRPGETLFPVSLLTRGPLIGTGGEPLGTCIDAMAGCGSGRLSYVVASRGGVAGIGETLRKLPWSQAEVEGNGLRARLDAAGFDRLEEVERDQWPAR